MHHLQWQYWRKLQNVNLGSNVLWWEVHFLFHTFEGLFQVHEDNSLFNFYWHEAFSDLFLFFWSQWKIRDRCNTYWHTEWQTDLQTNASTKILTYNCLNLHMLQVFVFVSAVYNYFSMLIFNCKFPIAMPWYFCDLYVQYYFLAHYIYTLMWHERMLPCVCMCLHVSARVQMYAFIIFIHILRF